MTKVYTSVNRILWAIPVVLLLFFSSIVSAQNPTTWIASSDCNFTYDFDSDDEDFSSPSIFSGDDDFTMFYDYAQGWWEETTTRMGEGNGETSIISPFYVNGENGSTVVGFYYKAPPGSEYRIRVVTVGSLDPNQEIVASTVNGPLWNDLPSTEGTLCIRINDADIESGQPLRYEVSFRAFTYGDIVFDDFQLSVQLSPLPVTFLGFVAKKEANDNVKLLWNVAKEQNVRGYELERSSDGVNFSRIGFVTATGSSVYSHVDAGLTKGTHYYRVRNIDFDGAYKYTGIVRVNVGSPANNNLQVYPNPAQDYVYVQHERAPGKANLRVLSLQGQELQRINVVPNSSQTSIITAKLTPGLYVVIYEDEEGRKETLKFIKQ